MNKETLERAKAIVSEIKDIKEFLDASSSEYSKLKLIKEKAESHMGSNFTAEYSCKFRSQMGNKIVELLKAHKAELEAEFEKL